MFLSKLWIHLTQSNSRESRPLWEGAGWPSEHATSDATERAAVVCLCAELCDTSTRTTRTERSLWEEWASAFSWSERSLRLYLPQRQPDLRIVDHLRRCRSVCGRLVEGSPPLSGSVYVSVHVLHVSVSVTRSGVWSSDRLHVHQGVCRSVRSTWLRLRLWSRCIGIRSGS